ncbi:hypothetical protein Pfo_019109 [Paulownia fortunei]|nr:hypothetical protein Pfo_019109 [Paulownia fortunei]
MLELSYKHLPQHLKLCFLYFGAFREDTEIPVRKLISLWIAAGFIHKEDQVNKKSLEDVGEKYLMDLISRSLILVSKRRSNSGVKACHIHDLLHNLCLKIIRGENFLHSIEKDTSSNRCWYPVIDFLTELESLNISLEGKVDWFSDVLRLPQNIKKLSLYKFNLSWNEISMIGRLPKLEILKLLKVAFEGKEWDTTDEEFQELKYLKLDRLQIVRWNIDSSEHFPKLERLVLRKCEKLEEIPPTLGDLPMLQMMVVELCSESVCYGIP